MIKTNNITKQEASRPEIYLGIGTHELKIKNIEVETASTGSKRFRIDFEGRGVEGVTYPEGNEGPTCRIRTYYLKEGSPYYEKNRDEFLGRLKTISAAFGVEDKWKEEYASLEEVASHVGGLLASTNKYAFYRITGEEYENNEGNIRVNLFLSRYNWFSMEDNLPIVDPTNQYDLKKVEVMDTNDTVSEDTGNRMY